MADLSRKDVFTRAEAASRVGLKSGVGLPVIAGDEVRNFKQIKVGDMVVARYRTDGALDTGFASSGIRRIDFANDYDYAYAVTVQPDGKIVAAGQAGTTSGSHFGLVRLTAAGALDPSFDGDGRATTAFDGFFGGKATDARVGGVAVMGNGLVAAGTAGTGTRRIALAPYGFDGRPDTRFGTGGAAAPAIGSFVWALST